MKVQLKCGHVQQSDALSIGLLEVTERVFCDQGHGLQKIAAIDCREWRTVCPMCKHRKWFGQDKAGAHYYVNSHEARSHHTGGSVEYMVVPDLKQRVTLAHGKLVKCYVEDSRSVDPNVSNYVSSNVAKQELLSDDPPF